MPPKFPLVISAHPAAQVCDLDHSRGVRICYHGDATPRRDINFVAILNDPACRGIVSVNFPPGSLLWRFRHAPQPDLLSPFRVATAGGASLFRSATEPCPHSLARVLSWRPSTAG